MKFRTWNLKQLKMQATTLAISGVATGLIATSAHAAWVINGSMTTIPFWFDLMEAVSAYFGLM